MAGTVILYCPDANASDLTDLSNGTQSRYRCEPEGDNADQKPTLVNVESYCALAETDCSSVAGEAGGTGAVITSAEDFAEISGWMMVIFAISFGVRAIRKTISSKI